MAWKEACLDVILVPAAVIILASYHSFLMYKLKKHPLQTVIGINNMGTRAWVRAVMKDMDKKNILAVQTLRNSIMASTLMATTAILLCSGLAAFLSSNYSAKKTIEDGIYGAKDEFSIELKFLCMMGCFLFSFLCYTQSIRFVNLANYVINVPLNECPTLTPEYVGDVLTKGFALYSIGTRSFYLALPLLFWICGPIPVLLSAILLVPLLYHVDIVKDYLPHDKLAF